MFSKGQSHLKGSGLADLQTRLREKISDETDPFSLPSCIYVVYNLYLLGHNYAEWLAIGWDRQTCRFAQCYLMFYETGVVASHKTSSKLSEVEITKKINIITTLNAVKSHFLAHLINLKWVITIESDRICQFASFLGLLLGSQPIKDKGSEPGGDWGAGRGSGGSALAETPGGGQRGGQDLATFLRSIRRH